MNNKKKHERRKNYEKKTQVKYQLMRKPLFSANSFKQKKIFEKIHSNKNPLQILKNEENSNKNPRRI